MTAVYQARKLELAAHPRRWLVTGVAGFIGSNILEALLSLGQHVVGLDDLSTGHRENLDDIRAAVTADQWSKFRFVEGDILNGDTCRDAAAGVDLILHQAALGSVPRSIRDPIRTHRVNTEGFLNVMLAARDAGVKRMVYAASSSTYGDHPDLPKIEDRIGRPLSPYAVTKLVNELYADVFHRTYGTESIGLRYFNVFGPHQDPNGAYAAVVPKWIMGMMNGDAITINGDGETSRDFCFVANAVQANILAATVDDGAAVNQVYNIAVGDQTNLNQLERMIRDEVAEQGHIRNVPPATHTDFRPGDVRHSLASIDKAKRLLGYQPSHSVGAGMKECIAWYLAARSKAPAPILG